MRPQTATGDTTPVTALDGPGEAAGIDVAALRTHLDRVLPGFVRGDLQVSLLAGGHSNLTYEVRDGGSRWVLRRPPFGERDPAAHDVHREYQAMQALQGTGIPVPETIVYCADTEVIGAPFFLMSFVDGVIYRTRADTAALGPARARVMSLSLVDVLARLHALDPVGVGLGDFGRPEGYLERQVRRFTDVAERTMQAYPEVDVLVANLRSAVPVSGSPAIVHGDFRLDNAVVGPDDGIAAVLDWEMATLGDPLADLGLLWCYWEGLPHNEADTMRKGIDPGLGFPPIGDLVHRYSVRTSRDISALPWYVAFGYFKLAVLRSAIHQRYLRGNTPSLEFATVGDLIVPLLAQARLTLENR